MKRLCLLAFALMLGLGCVTPEDKKQWQEVFKDARGDNMQMRGFGDSARSRTAPQ
jgi:hypothetical protein